LGNFDEDMVESSQQHKKILQFCNNLKEKFAQILLQRETLLIQVFILIVAEVQYQSE
jgi:hypothetical protein